MKSSVKKTIIKLFVALLILLVGLSSLFLVGKYLKPKKPEASIEVNIEIVAIDGTILHYDTFNASNKSLVDLLNEGYECKMEVGPYGYTLLSLAELKTNFKDSYIAIYVDNSYSSLGISNITLYDGIVVSFRETKI